MDKTILHCDLNGFYASVECLINPSIANKPVVVAGNPDNRHGIILAKNELAKKYNIVTGDTLWMAKSKCPEIEIVPPQHKHYIKYSELVNAIYRDFTDLVEPFGIDESWLDVTGVRQLFGDGKQIADSLRKRVREEIGLTISVGVSFNKTYAKLGSDYKKPDATTVISGENYKDIVYPLPVGALLFVGKSAQRTLEKMYIYTIGDLAMSNKELVRNRLGKVGEMIWNYANGIDDSPVRSAYDPREVKSVGNGMTFRRDLISMGDIRQGADYLCDEVACRMRRKGFSCYTVAVALKDCDFKTHSKQRTLEQPISTSREMLDICMELVGQCIKAGTPVRSITVTASNLIESEEVTHQLNLFEQPVDYAKQEKLESTLYKIRQRYGKDAIFKGSGMDSDIGTGKE